MAALKKSHLDAPPGVTARVAAPAPTYPRATFEGDAGGPNPALQSQLERLAEFGAAVSDPHVTRFSPRVRLAILGGAAILPWFGIWLLVRAVF
jgi:hypothetical protein